MGWRRKIYPHPSPEQARREARQNARFGVAVFLVALVPMGVFIAMWVPERRLAGGTGVEADVVDVVSIRSRSRGLPDTSNVRVRFETVDGDEIVTTLRTTRTQIGGRMSLTYDPTDPTRVRASDGPEQAWRVPLIIGLTLLWLAGLGGWIALRLHIGKPSRLYLKNRPSRPDDLV